MPTTATPVLTACHVAPSADGFVVTPEWSDVDRPTTSSWEVRTRALADRLAAAVMAGVVCVNPHVATDVNEHTYVSYDRKVMAKYANADLKRLGF